MLWFAIKNRWHFGKNCIFVHLDSEHFSGNYLKCKWLCIVDVDRIFNSLASAELTFARRTDHLGWIFTGCKGLPDSTYVFYGWRSTTSWFSSTFSILFSKSMWELGAGFGDSKWVVKNWLITMVIGNDKGANYRSFCLQKEALQILVKCRGNLKQSHKW